MVAETFQVGEYLVEVYNDPSESLSLQRQEKLIQECLLVARNGFGEQYVDEDAVRQRLIKSSTSIVIRNHSKQVVGIAGSSILYLDEGVVIYLQGATVSKKYQTLGLYNLSVAARIMIELKKIDSHHMKDEKIFIATRTQSPLIYRFMHRKLGLFPYPNGYIDKNIKIIARKFSTIIHSNHNHYKNQTINLFDDNVFIIRKSLKIIKDEREILLNIYKDRIPFCTDDDEINEYMKENLNWNNGDALIMIGIYRQKDIVSLFPTINASTLIVPWE